MSELTKEDIDVARTCLLEDFELPISPRIVSQICNAALRGIEIKAVKHEGDALEYSLAMVLADIRIKTGVGVEPMLSELADVLAAKIAAKDARIAELEVALKPFADVARHYEYENNENVIAWGVNPVIADLRRAAALLEKKQ